MKKIALILLVTVPLFAKSVTVVNDAPGQVTGTITNVTGANVTIGGVSVNAGGATVRTSRGTGNHNLLAPGMRVIAMLAPNSLNATSIIADPDLRITGTVEGLQANGFRMLGRTVAVNAQTQFGGYGLGTPLRSLNDLPAQISVTVDVALDGGNFTAIRVFGNGAVPPPPTAKPIPAKSEFTDAVKSIDGKIWMVGTTRVIASPQTKVTGEPKVGDRVKVIGVQSPDKNVLAVSITKV